MARDAAEAGNRSKAEFLAIISHELRTPLNGVIGMAGLLLDAELDQRSRQHAQTLNEAADHLLQLINDFLDFTKLEANRLAFEEIVFDPDAVVRSVIDLATARARAKGLHISKYLSPNVPAAVVGDPGRLRQVLLNLMSNAVKFTQTGTVSVEVRCENADDHEATLAFAVKDTGIGISTRQVALPIPRVQPGYSSISRRFGGTGLGLAICRRLVARMRGTIGVESEPMVGSTFYFTACFKLPQSSIVADAAPALDGHRILLVDENETDGEALRTELSSRGALVTAIDDPCGMVAALRKAASDNAQFHAALVTSGPSGLRCTNSVARSTRRAADLAPSRLILSASRDRMRMRASSPRAFSTRCWSGPYPRTRSSGPCR